MPEYFCKMKALVDSLVLAISPLREEEIVPYMLTGLGQDYDSLTTSVSTRVEPIGMNELYTHLINYELRHAT